jgi:hypothetical protein
MPPVLVLPYATLSFAFFAPLREAQAFPLARSLHSLKPSAVKTSASQGEETGGIARATHSKRQGTFLINLRFSVVLPQDFLIWLQPLIWQVFTLLLSLTKDCFYKEEKDEKASTGRSLFAIVHQGTA